MNITKRTQELEKQILSPYATLSVNTKGREREEDDCNIRTPFQRDKDRIIYSKAFRRLKHKTQVFISPEGDHYRTRLTHTLEVAQIARTVARSLRLNEDLSEACALGHDLGHTPFGHAGEDVLNLVTTRGFKHNEQSLRVVEVLEGDDGLNLTLEVRDGILNHCGSNMAQTLEGQIVKFADRIAYVNHDIDDAKRARIITEANLPKEAVRILGRDFGPRINTMVTDIIKNSIDKDKISMSKEVEDAMLELRKYMFDNVYTNSLAKKEEKKSKEIVRMLYEYFLENINLLPDEYKKMLNKYDSERMVCDYIAGMTDRYAIKIFNEIYVPSCFF